MVLIIGQIGKIGRVKPKYRKRLVKDLNQIVGGVFEVDQSNRIEELNKNSYVAVVRNEIKFCIIIPKQVKRKVYKIYLSDGRKKLFAPALFAKAIVTLLMKKNTIPARVEIDTEYPGYEDLITRIIRTHSHHIEVHFKEIGKKSSAHLLAYSFGRKGRNKKSTVEPIYGTAADLHPEFTGIRTRTRSN